MQYERDDERRVDAVASRALVRFYFNHLWPTSRSYWFIIQSVFSVVYCECGLVTKRNMSGKNRRNNNQRQQEPEVAIASVQCDGLVSRNIIKFNRKLYEIRWNSLIENLYMCRHMSYTLHMLLIRQHITRYMYGRWWEEQNCQIQWHLY